MAGVAFGAGYNWGNEFPGVTASGTVVLQAITGMSDKNWKGIWKGDNFTIAMDADGYLWAWGSNDWGQLGTGDGLDKTVPTKIDNNVYTHVSIPYNGRMVAAIRADGTLWAWGRNNEYMFGDGTDPDVEVYSPTQILVGSTFTDVSVGNDSVIAIKTDGTLWGWGDNTWGVLGQGHINEVQNPLQLQAGTNWASVRMYSASCVAINNSDQVYFAGSGNTVHAYSNSFVNTGYVFEKLEFDFSMAAGIKANGTLWTWGDESARLGLGATGGDVLTPTQVGAAANWTQAGCYGSFFAINSNNELWMAGDGTNFGLTTPLDTLTQIDEDWESIDQGNGSTQYFIQKLPTPFWTNFKDQTETL